MTPVTGYICQYNNLRGSTRKPLTPMYAIWFHAPSTSHHALCLSHSHISRYGCHQQLRICGTFHHHNQGPLIHGMAPLGVEESYMEDR
jgi:hypothetical protein